MPLNDNLIGRRRNSKSAKGSFLGAIAFYAFIFSCIIIIPCVASAEVQGELKAIDGIRVLHVWGTYYEMGYAHGYLLAEDIVELFDKVFVPLVGGAALMEYNKEVYRDHYEMPVWHAEEVNGLLDGIAAAGVSLNLESLGRDLDGDDFGTMDALSDIRTVYACASFAAWDETTSSDTTLAGESALARNLDWWTPAAHPYLLAKNTVVIGREPETARATLMVGFSGMSGCYSCMNEAGVATTRMMSNHGTPQEQMDTSRPFMPLNMVMRDALEADDVDGDGESTVNDVSTALSQSSRSSAYNIMIVGPTAAGWEPVVVEINNLQFAERRGSDNSDLPTEVLASTNHMRKLYPPVPDARYSAMKRNVVTWDGVLSLQRFWQILQAMYDEWMTGATTQSMIFVPFNRSLALTYTDEETLAPFKTPVWLNWEDVFGVVENDDDTDNNDWHNPGDDEYNDSDDDSTVDQIASGDDETESACCG